MQAPNTTKATSSPDAVRTNFPISSEMAVVLALPLGRKNHKILGHGRGIDQHCSHQQRYEQKNVCFTLILPSVFPKGPT